MAKQVELLAPCGNYESFLAAVNAGADAVYLGGRQFGARAYAENFSEEELIGVIRQAHLFGVRVYLTVNTLLKERELSELYGYIGPLYEAGLDGVIVQDMGVLAFIKRNFPGLKLHASTQMTITGVYGAAFLKSLGCERIVPARELSLLEIREIREKVSVEIETFIHGSMCYCYSGQCLMSSMIGGRSGNRGRCAQPCRLPYRTGGKEGYYLSLKDMNTLEHIPELIEAGIDSFKIEGRMKRAEYVAGVVSVYRKYIDEYYRVAGGNVSPQDKRILSSLYIRSETGSGYYQRSRGREMLTLQRPGYNEADREILGKLCGKYVRELPKKKLRFAVSCLAGEPLSGAVSFTDCRSGMEVCLRATGTSVEKADRRPVSEAEIYGQMVKTGGTPFTAEQCRVELDGNVFVPMSRVKELRRELLQKIYEYYGARKLPEQERKITAKKEEETGRTKTDRVEAEESCVLTVLVQSKEQFEAVFSAMEEQAEQEVRGAAKERLILDADLLLEEKEIRERLAGGKVSWGIRCPIIVRSGEEGFLRRLEELVGRKKPGVIYCGTMDGFAWAKSISYRGEIAGEASLYAWNSEAVSCWKREVSRISIPLELDSREIRELCRALEETGFLEAPVYGRVPFMITANCLKLSSGKCDRNRKQYTELKDRKGNVFPVYTNCSHCYNIIYNCLPTSYHDGIGMLWEDGIRAFRVEFTVESGREAKAVLQTFRGLLASELTGQKGGQEKTFPVRTTKGHFGRGVE